ncbi:MAG TPA: cupin domain-containing protein [Gaiellaceae bacterium]|nr:cupin domain-containing protein [Gaiellaceae bacterium]
MELDVHRPALLVPGEGETVTDRPERTLRILADRDELTVTWFRYVPGEKGPDPHIHRQHTDAFYVLEGEVEFGLGPEVQAVRGEAGTLAAAPSNVVHTFRNASDATAIFLNVHAPSMGFGDMLRARRDGREEDVERFDQFDPPAGGGRALADAVVSASGKGDWIESRSRILVKAGAQDGDGHLAVFETVLPSGYPGPPLHLHRKTAEGFLVLDGTVVFTVGETEAELDTGAFALVPPHLPHTFSNPEDAEARCLTIASPGGVEEFIRAAASADPSELAALGARYDTFLAGA